MIRPSYYLTGRLQACTPRAFGYSSWTRILAEHARVPGKIWYVPYHYMGLNPHSKSPFCCLDVICLETTCTSDITSEVVLYSFEMVFMKIDFDL